MTPPEFEVYKARFGGAFPSIGCWLDRLGDEIKTEQLRIWQSVLADVSLDDALKVVDLMADGELAPVGNYDSDRERAAVVVRAHVEELARDRSEAEAERAAIQTEAAPLPSNANVSPGLYRRIIAMQNEGATTDEIKAAIDSELGGHPFDDSRVRYSCVLCRDTGYVTVWAPHTMRVFGRNGTVDQRDRRTCAVACSCSRADSKCSGAAVLTGRKRGGPKPKLFSEDARYSPTAYCIVEGGDTSEAAFADFAIWCSAFFDQLRNESASRLVDERQLF